MPTTVQTARMTGVDTRNNPKTTSDMTYVAKDHRLANGENSVYVGDGLEFLLLAGAHDVDLFNIV